MSRKALVLLLVLLLAPAVSAGSATDPELTDGDADASPTAGDDCKIGGTDAPAQTCADSTAGLGAATASGAGEILSAWVSEPDDASYTLTVNTSAAGDADTTYAISFKVTPTDLSLYTGVAEHTVYANITGTTLADGPEGTTVAQNADDASLLEVTFTRTATEAVGGDAITAIAVSVSDTTVNSRGTSPAQMTRTDTTTDTTDAVSRAYNLSRIPVSASATVEVTDATLTQDVNGTLTSTDFPGELVTTAEGDAVDATIQYTVSVTNTGTDPDTFTVEVYDNSGTLADAGIDTTVSPASADLDPGETSFFLLTATLTSVAPDDYTVTVVANSAVSGGIAGGDLTTITVPAVPPAPEPEPEPVVDNEPAAARTPVPEGLSFLTPAAEALGLDGPFDEYAELVFLAIVLLLVIIIVFLIIFLATRSSFQLVIEPRVLSVAPGQTATFDVQVRNKQGQAVDAVAHFEGDPHWQTGIRFGEAAMTEQGVDGQLRLGPKDQDSAVRHGQLDVTAPADVGDKETDQVTVTVARLNDMGQPVKPKRTTVRVRAAAPQGGPVQLTGVAHTPDSPAVGDLVTTTATLQNATDHTLAVRVVLTVDGEDLQERSLLLPPEDSDEVSFEWVVPSDSSKVRVRVFEQ